MPTDDDLDRRIAVTARSTLEQVRRTIDPSVEYESFRRHLDGAAMVDLSPPPVGLRRRWTVAAAAAVVTVAMGATALLVSRDRSSDAVAPPPLPAPSSTNESTVPATTTSSTTTSTTATIPLLTLATASPSVVSAGGQVTVTPTGFLTRSCLDIVTATRRDGGSPGIGQIVDGRWMTPETGTAVTYPACLGEYSNAGFTFTVPTTLPPGPYAMCLTQDLSPAGCAIVEVTPPSAEAAACASEPFAPQTLVDSTPAGHVSIDADANGRAARWGATDALNRVSQILDTAVDPESIDAAIAEGRSFAAGAFQAAVLPVGDPPLGSIMIFLRDTTTGCLRWYYVGPGLDDDEARRFAQAWVEALASETAERSVIGQRWPIGTDSPHFREVGQVGIGMVLGVPQTSEGTMVFNSLIEAVVEVSPSPSSGLGGVYRFVFASRDGGDWVVTHEATVELADDEMLSLAHERCGRDGITDPNLVAVLGPPETDGVPDFAARTWPARKAWTYSNGLLNEQNPEMIFCDLTGE